MLSESISSGNNEEKEVLPHKENTFIESSRKHNFKANKRFGNQKTGNNLVLQNRFEILDVEGNFMAHELPNRRENLIFQIHQTTPITLRTTNCQTNLIVQGDDHKL